jgi:glyoxylase I family protein
MPMPSVFPAIKGSSPFAAFRPHHVGLRVADLDAAIGWYTGTLDFRVMHRMTLGERQFVYLAPAVHDDFWIELLGGQKTYTRPSTEDAMLAGWDHICLRVESADETIAELKRRGVTIFREPFDVAPISHRIAFFSDPWGNTFELFQPLDV